MKNIFLIIAISFAALFTSCEPLDLKEDVPTCIKKKIRDISNADVFNPPAKVYKWEVDGKTYYYITSNCCDQYNFLFDTKCNVVCAPDGGFTGNGDGNCPNWTGPITQTLVWQDERK